MEIIKLILLFTTLFFGAQALQNLMGTDLQKCINCLCHARTGCYSRFNCARYSVSFDYWKRAGSPVIDADDDPDDQASYKKCIGNENCIVNAIAKYTSLFGELDCNCDGKFDCKDRLAIHLNGNKCRNPNFGERYARRFNQCAGEIGVNAMLKTEGFEECQVNPQ